VPDLKLTSSCSILTAISATGWKKIDKRLPN